MLTKIIVLAVSVAIVSGSGHHYPQKSHKDYKLSYEHRIPAQEPSSEEYKPESQEHAYSSQSLVQGHTVAYEESHEANADHEVPVYQYQVDEQSEDTAPAYKAPVQHQYQLHYPQHEIQAVRIPAHHKTAYYPESHGVHKVPVYHSESNEHKVPYYQSETHKAQHQKLHFQPESHGVHKVPVYHSESNEHRAPYYQSETHEAQHQKLHFQPESHEAPAYHTSHAPAHSEPHAHDEPIDYYAYPKYQYEYKVDDPHTGDNKFQHEIRDGDVVKGIYGLQDADGSFRTVEYSSDKHHGFSAIVKHSAPGQHVHIESHHPNEHDQEN